MLAARVWDEAYILNPTIKLQTRRTPSPACEQARDEATQTKNTQILHSQLEIGRMMTIQHSTGALFESSCARKSGSFGRLAIVSGLESCVQWSFGAFGSVVWGFSGFLGL